MPRRYIINASLHKCISLMFMLQVQEGKVSFLLVKTTSRISIMQTSMISIIGMANYTDIVNYLIFSIVYTCCPFLSIVYVNCPFCSLLSISNVHVCLISMSVVHVCLLSMSVVHVCLFLSVVHVCSLLSI